MAMCAKSSTHLKAKEGKNYNMQRLAEGAEVSSGAALCCRPSKH